MGPKTRLGLGFALIAAWTLFVDAVYDHSWPGTDVRWWALFVAWFGGSYVLMLIVESVARSRRERREQ